MAFMLFLSRRAKLCNCLRLLSEQEIRLFPETTSQFDMGQT